MGRVTIILVIIAAMAFFFIFDLDNLLTLENVKANQAELADFRESMPVLTSLVYFSLYVLVTALSLPGAAIMTIVSGALFGLFWGFLLSSFASTIGATLAFLASRYLLRDSVQNRFGDKLTVINEGIAIDGLFYLFTLRLVPIFPFFLINILMGLTRIKTWAFSWVSQLGMLAGTLIYVNAGTQIAQIENLREILSPSLLLSLTLIGIFPTIAKKIIKTIQKKRKVRRLQQSKAL